MVKELITTNGTTILLDDQDYDYFNRWSWYLGKDKYAYRNTGLKHVCLHRLIAEKMSPDFEGEVDHKDRNPFNCTRENLRPCTKSQNAMNRAIGSTNTSGYKGVYFHRVRRKWVAQIKRDRLVIYLGIFECPKKAALTYNNAARRMYGEFAYQNEIL